MNKNLLIVGSKQYGEVIKDIAETMGCFVKIAFLDDDREDSVGKLDDVEELCTEYSCAISTCDDGMKRAKLNNRLKEATYIVPQIVHLSCSVSLSFGMGEGCILEPGAVIGSKSTLGNSVIIGANSVVENNCFFMMAVG